MRVRRKVEGEQVARAVTTLERTELELSDVLRELRQLRDDMRVEIYGAPVHVWPNKEHDHVLRGGRCWCDPQVTRSRDAADIVVHNRAQ